MKPLPAALSLFALLFVLGGCSTLPGMERVLPPEPAPTAERAAADAAPCPQGARQGVLVTGFPLRYPEQIPYGGYVGWPGATAEALAQALTQGGRLHATAAPGRFPFVSPDSAPAVEQSGGRPVIVEWARQANAGHLVAGVFRDFAVVQNRFLVPERHIVVDAFLFDGRDGRLLTQREFAWKLPLSKGFPESALPGTREFAASRFGQLYHALLDDIARWVGAEIPCPTAQFPQPRPRGQR